MSSYSLRLPAWIASLVLAATVATPVVAQVSSCNQLNSQLRALEADPSFRNQEAYARDARATGENIRRLESAFVRGGCQRALNAGQQLNRDCRALANQITRSRADYAGLVEAANRGVQVAQVREQVLQQIARFGCNSSSTVTFGAPPPQNRGGLLQRLFGRIARGGNDFIGDQWGYRGQSTLRTVCVRSCDGYYWPVSFSTVSEYLINDAAVCSNQCPNADVELYYYHNPGEEAEDMINLSGSRYADLPNAFRYREVFDSACTCQQQINYGTIEFGDGETANPLISFGDLSFPMPRRDPRQTAEIAVAEALFVPLPRRRPARDGEPVVAIPVAEAAGDLRLVEFGGRTVRIVGPDTPYVPKPAAGS